MASGHTAIPNWSGYIYQGLCAAYVALRICIEHSDIAADLYLSLDSYEDFSILDANKMILSLHQCKCYAPYSNKDFLGEFAKMRQKKSDWVNDNKCHPNAQMFFHCNEAVNVDPDITKYVYKDGSIEVQPDEIGNKITLLLQEYNQKLKKQIAVEVLKRRLYYWIDDKVLKVHRKAMLAGQGKTFNVSVNETLKINDLFMLLQGDGVSDLISKNEMASNVRLHYLKKLNDVYDTKKKRGKYINEQTVSCLMNALANYPADKLWNLFVRLCPQESVSKVDEALGFGGNNAGCLFKVINEVTEPVDSNVQWGDNGTFKTPATFSCHEDIDEICYEIIKNGPNLDVLFNYRWIVADTDETVDNLYSKCQDITKNTDIDYTDEDNKIFNPGNIGILTIKDKNNGKY